MNWWGLNRRTSCAVADLKKRSRHSRESGNPVLCWCRHVTRPSRAPWVPAFAGTTLGNGPMDLMASECAGSLLFDIRVRSSTFALHTST